jgi:catechol 2,3-dioxygenase-like lactoylglutathione lyase family enzyme
MSEYLFCGCAHVGIMTGDVQKCVDFYCNNLGFRPFYKGQMGPMPLTFVECGGLIVEFIAAGNAKPGGAVDHIALEVQGIEAIVEKLRANGVEIGPVGSAPNFFPNGMKNVFFTGPNGETLEYVEYAK